jgi:hypothetical protein
MSEENNSEEHNREGSFWENGRSIGDLPFSTHVMAQERRDIIKLALGLDIKDVRTYAGYKGDLVVEITASDIDILKKIQGWAENMDMQTVIKENPMNMIHELFCITKDEDVYALVEPK